jgi:hypothetical protein
MFGWTTGMVSAAYAADIVVSWRSGATMLMGSVSPPQVQTFKMSRKMTVNVAMPRRNAHVITPPAWIL